MLEDEPKKTLNDLIRDSGLTWKELSSRIGVSQSAIASWCKSDPDLRKMPSLEKAVALAVELDIDIKTLAKSLDIPRWDKLP
jgi:transcriptional regulator with XRE-family HTH domain